MTELPSYAVVALLIYTHGLVAAAAWLATDRTPRDSSEWMAVAFVVVAWPLALATLLGIRVTRVITERRRERRVRQALAYYAAKDKSAAEAGDA